MNKHVIQLNHVYFSYGEKSVLEDISISFTAARITFIMGNNGSGKTTLLKNIMGFLSAKAGTIEINGKSGKLLDPKAMSRLISYVPQAIRLNTDFTVIDYLSLGRNPHLEFLSKLNSTDYRIIEKVADELGITELFEVPFNNLSGGQKQIVAVARSLIQDTPIIILDEPMSALDIGKQVDLLNVLWNQSKAGKTIILTTHNPNHALAVDSDACFIKQGTVIACGRSEEIIQNDLLYKIYGNNIMLYSEFKNRSVIFNTESMMG